MSKRWRISVIVSINGILFLYFLFSILLCIFVRVFLKRVIKAFDAGRWLQMAQFKGQANYQSKLLMQPSASFWHAKSKSILLYRGS